MQYVERCARVFGRDRRHHRVDVALEVAAVLLAERFEAAIAQAGALAGLLDEEHQDRTRAVNKEGKQFLEALFNRLGLEFIPTHANSILVKVGDGDALFHHAMKKGVILRAMRAYGLPDWIRVSIGTMPQNQKFAAILEAWLPSRG